MPFVPWPDAEDAPERPAAGGAGTSPARGGFLGGPEHSPGGMVRAVRTGNDRSERLTARSCAEHGAVHGGPPDTKVARALVCQTPQATQVCPLSVHLLDSAVVHGRWGTTATGQLE